MYQVCWKELTRLNKSDLKRQGIYSGLPENWQTHEKCKDSRGRYNHFKACKYVKDTIEVKEACGPTPHESEYLKEQNKILKDFNKFFGEIFKEISEDLNDLGETLEQQEKSIKDLESMIYIDVCAVEVVNDKELLSIGPSTMRKINF